MILPFDIPNENKVETSRIYAGNKKKQKPTAICIVCLVSKLF